VLEIAYLALGLVGVVRMSKLILDRDRQWSLCVIVAGAMMPSYFVGAVVTLAQYDPTSSDFVLPGGEDLLSHAMGPILYLNLFYWVLVGLGRYEHKFWRQSLGLLSSTAAWRDDEGARPAIGVSLIGLTVAQLYLILSGGVTLGGVDVSQDIQLPIGAALVISFSDPLLAISGWIIGRWRRPLTMARLAIFSSACQAVWLGSLGRRYLLYGVVVFLCMFFWARGRQKGNRVVYVAVPVLGMLYFFTKLFVAMRYANYSYGDIGGAQSLTMLYSDAFSLLSNDADTIADAEKDNYASRFFILGHLSTVMHGLTLSLAQFGKFLFISMVLCIPSAFFPGKTDLITKNNWGADGKAILNDVLGLPQLDTAWTPMVAAYGDFMWLGAFLYPLIFLLLGWIFSRIVQSIRYPSFVICSLGLCFNEFLWTEAGMSTFLLTGRTLIFVWLISKVVEFFDAPAVR
jgi:hypothetical protein